MNIKKKSICSVILILCFILCLVLILKYEDIFSVTFPSWNSLFGTKEILETATSLDECVIFAPTTDEELKILPFRSADGTYYLVIPSMAESFYFGNLSKDCSLTVDGERLKSNTDSILIEENIDMTITLNDSETLQVLKSQNISAMFVDVEVSQEVLDEQKGIGYGGECVLVNPEGETVVSDSFEYIAPRGNTTFAQVKKPYELRFNESKTLVNSCSGRKWVLLANAVDSSLLKNGLVYDFVNSHTNMLTATGEYVDLYINGDYRGNYYLCNRPQAEGSFLESLKLNQYKYTSESHDSDEEMIYLANEDGTVYGRDDATSTVPGSECVFLIEFTLQKCPPNYPGFYTKSGKWARVLIPQDVTLSQVQYIKERFDELEDTVNTENGINPDTNKKIEDYLEIESYAHRYLIDNVFQNHDSGLASSYFYKKPDSIDARIYAGPIWDYDHTMHHQKYFSMLDTSVLGDVYLGENLLKHDFFVAYLEKVYDDIYKPYVKYEMPLSVYRINETISRSRNLNHLRWDISALSDTAIVDGLVDVTLERLNAIENRILCEDLYCTVTFLDYDKRIQCVEVVKRGEVMENIPDANCWVGIFNGWKCQNDGTILTRDTKIWEDVTFESQWIEIDLLVQNGIDISKVDIDSVNLEALENTVEEIKRRKEMGE